MPAQSRPLSGALESWQEGPPTCWQPENTRAPSTASGQRALRAACLHKPPPSVAQFPVVPAPAQPELFLLKIIILFTGSLYVGKMVETGGSADCLVVPFVWRVQIDCQVKAEKGGAKHRGTCVFWSWYLDASGSRRSFLQEKGLALSRDQARARVA